MSEWASQKFEQFQKLYNDARKKFEQQLADLEEQIKKFPGYEDSEIGKRRRDSLDKFNEQLQDWGQQIAQAKTRVDELTTYKKTWDSKQGDYKTLQSQVAEIQKAAKEDDGKALGNAPVELANTVSEIDVLSKAEKFKDAVEKLEGAVDFAKELVERIKKGLSSEDDKKLDPSDVKQIQSDIELIEKGFKVFEDAGGKVPGWITGPLRVLKIAVDSSVDVLDAIGKASAALRKYNEAALSDAKALEDGQKSFLDDDQKIVEDAARDRQYLWNNVKFTLNWKNPESVTSHFVKNTVERYAPKMIADNWDKIAQKLR